MMTDSTDGAAAREHLSALADGEAFDAQVATTCLRWQDDAALRASWHAYQLIGDALRSDDLCSAPGRDAAFLVALRRRLADEPVVLAPLDIDATTGNLPPVAGARSRWRMPAAVAAAMVAAVGLVVGTHRTAPDAGSGALARSDAAVPVIVSAGSGDGSVAGPAAVVDARALVANGKLIRDVRLDRYLAAHKQFVGSSALGVPSGFLRNATADAADR